ncbi:MAG: hypothetical protein ABI990_09945 [Actinomycetota bacterium]
MTTYRLLLCAGLALALLALVLRLEQHAAHAFVADPVRTPGVLNPDVSAATLADTICKHGWTRTIRPPTTYTDALKRRQLRDYGLAGPLSGYQEDHLISLELGGHPTDPRNLWPEPYPRAARVDTIENELNAQVCSGALSLDAAQRKESELKHTEG